MELGFRMVLLSATSAGVLIPAHVQPRASKERLVGDHGGALKVAVTAPPEGGRANEAVAEMLARALGVARSRVTLATGPASRAKTFLVAGLAAEQVALLLRVALPGTEFAVRR